MVRYRKPVEPSDHIIDRRPFDAARRGRGAAGAAAKREEQARLQRIADEAMRLQLRRLRKNN